MLTFTLNGARLLADPSGALVCPDSQTLVVSDLHLEKGSAFAERGTPLPPYDTLATLDMLDAILARHRPGRVICLGDSFHDGGAAERVSDDAKRRIQTLTSRHEWIWIAGNHDPAPNPSWGGSVKSGLVCDHLAFRHQAHSAAVHGEVSGHFHPKARVKLRGRVAVGRCFVCDGARLLMPAFGAFTGGLEVTAPEIQSLLQPVWEVFFLGSTKVYRIARSSLLNPRRAAA